MIRKNQTAFLVSNFICYLAGFILALGYWVLRQIFPLTPGSHPVSRFCRQLFEDQKAHLYWGISLSMLILLTNSLISNTNTLAYANSRPQVINIAVNEELVTTQTNYRQPVDGVLTQGFHWYHRAIDVAAAENKPVFPIADGKIITTEYLAWGYGHLVLIDHGEGIQSLYAHFNNILVKPGDQVTKTTILGGIGLTGWTTGPHLHLEIYDHGVAINPQEVLPESSS